MSDVEDDLTVPTAPDAALPEEEEEEEQDAPAPGGHKARRRGLDNEEDEDEEDEDDDEDDEEEEDEGMDRGKKRAKRRHKRPAVNRFLDVEAVVDEEDEEDEDEEDYGRDEFIADPGADGEEDDHRRAAAHARLEQRERELNDQDLNRIAEDFTARYKMTASRYTGDMNEIPQRLLMPSVQDANLWQVRVKPGKERDLVMSLMRKAIDLEYTGRPLQILSVFQRDSLPGMIYVEARSSKQVSEACNGLVGIYPSRGIILVPIEEMASLLQIKKQDLTVTPGSWVRIRRGKYQGDLAQVMDITENGEEVGLKFIPRIDLNPKDDALTPDGKKRKKLLGTASANMRAPLRFFNFEEVAKVYGRKGIAKRNQVYVFQNDTYKDGFVEKDFKLSALQLDDVNPTLDEITRFSRGQDGAENHTVDLSIIAEASRKAAIAVLQPGDHIEVFEGEQAGVHGIVQSVAQDIVTISASGVELDGQKIDLPARSVRKRFKAGDHVKVMTGKNADETGLVVSVTDNVVTFLSDMSMQEVSVFSKDLREAAEVGSGTNIVGNYELHDLVQLDLQTVGVIFKTERDSFRVLDQNGQVRLVQPHQISMRRDSHRAIATDSEGHELHVNDNVKEVEGENRKGQVLHIHQSYFAFLHNREIPENGGVFVTRARSLASLAPKGNAMKIAIDSTKMNPQVAGGAGGGMVGSGNMGRGPRDRLVGVIVMVTQGPNKGYVGSIKDTNGTVARVELTTNNKVITIDKTKLWRRNPDGSLEPLEGNRRMGPPQNFNPGMGGVARPNYNQNGGRTPGWNTGSGKTPNPYAQGSATPSWSSSRTPNPYSGGGGDKTPAWNASSRTPNPYAGGGGKTPAWDASARTPNPYAAGGSGGGGWGGATPRASAGWATPKAPAASSSTSWGGATPNPKNSGWNAASPERSAGGSWGDSGSGNAMDWSSGATSPNAGGSAYSSAPTPGAYLGAPTPGAYLGAPTPGAYAGAPTPGATAPTPGYPYAVNTPAGVFASGDSMSAPTPGVSMDVPYDQPEENNTLMDKYWLLKAPRQAGLLVEVKGSRPGMSDTLPEGFYGGEKEGEQGVVKSVMEKAMVGKGQATVKLANEDVYPHVEFVVAVPPTAAHQKVVPFDGKFRGDVVTTVEKDDATWVVISEQGTYDFVKETLLCRFAD